MIRRLFRIVLAALAMFAMSQTASAQFYKPVVRLMGTISEKHGKPIVARVSVRDAADTTKEIVSSRSNSITGKYLAILQPSQKYLILVRADSLIPQSVAISTPATDRNTDLVRDFMMQRMHPEHKKPAKLPNTKKSLKKSLKKRK